MNFIGDKFEELDRSERYDLKKIKTRIAKDLVKEFPKHLYRFRLRREGYSSIDILIIKAPSFELVNPIENTEENLRYNFQFKESFINKIQHIANAYNYDNSDIMSDYFDTNFYLDIKCRWWNTSKKICEGTQII